LVRASFGITAKRWAQHPGQASLRQRNQATAEPTEPSYEEYLPRVIFLIVYSRSTSGRFFRIIINAKILFIEPQLDMGIMNNQSNRHLQNNTWLSPPIWAAILILFLVALGGLVFNLRNLFNAHVTADPTSVPQSTSREIEITSTFSISAETGFFTIWGVPVNTGLICSRGEVFDLEYHDISPSSEQLTDLLIRKSFVCKDGSGSFEMDLDVEIFDTGTAGKWVITSGEGNYSQLIGSGTVKGTYLDQDLVVDTYQGTVENE